VTDTQWPTIAIAIIAPLSALLYSNRRITGAKETLRPLGRKATGQEAYRTCLAEIGESKQALRLEMPTLHGEIRETKQTLRGEMQTLRGDMRLGFERISNKLDHLAGEVAILKELMSTHWREHHKIK